MLKYISIFLKEVTKIKSDIAWKFVLKALFEDFVLFFMPDLYPLVDFSVDPDFLDQEFETLFPETKAENRKVDKLVNLKLKDGKDSLVLVHAEIQSYYDNEFEKRMFDYYIRIFDHYQMNIDAIAVFTYSGDSHKANIYNREFLQTKITYQYRTYDISKSNEDELLASNNPFALVSYVAKKSITHQPSDINNYNFKIELTKILLEKGYNKKRIVSVFRFLGFIFGIENELLRKKFKKEVNEMTAVKEIYELTDYEEDLIKEGKLEGETKSLRNKAIKLLTKKLGNIPKNLEERIVTCTDIEKLDSISDNIFDINSFDEVEKILG